MYFTALHAEGCSASQPVVDELYARIDGSQTVAVSEPTMTAEREKECSGVCREDQLEENGHKRSPARFEGASENGARVFFTTEQPLLNEDEDGERDLYEAEIEAGVVKRLIQVSHDPTKGQRADVVSVARISEDGSHVYYVAKGVLRTTPNGEMEKAEEGADNLYVYDTNSGRTAFVANLMTTTEKQELTAELTKERPKEIEAEVKQKEEERDKAREEKCVDEHPGEGTTEKEERTKCDTKAREESEVEAKEEETTKLRELAEEVAKGMSEGEIKKTGASPLDRHRPYETTPNGQFLVFVNARHLTGAEDTSTVGQVFEYNAQTESLVRVSAGQKSAGFPAGYGDNGNTTSAEDAPRILQTPDYHLEMVPTDPSRGLSLSEGGAVFFTSADALTPQAVAGRENVYEYHEGNVYLISPGDEAVPAQLPDGTRLLGTDEPGGDVFFSSTDSLVPQDTDTQASWYDARIGGGFPPPPSPVGCLEDACRGPLSASPSLSLAGGSETAVSGENLAPPPPTLASKPKPLTRAQMLAKAVKECNKKRKKKRLACLKQAEKRYGHTSRAIKSNGSSK